MKKKFISVLLFTTVFIFTASIIAGDTHIAVSGKAPAKEKLKYTLLTEDYPPFSYQENGKLKGISVEIVQEILKRLDLQYLKINLQEWDIAYKQALHTPGVIIFSLTRTAQRENSFKWVGPIATSYLVLFGLNNKSSDNIIIDNLDAAKKYSIGVLDQSAVYFYLQSNGFTKLITSLTPESTADQLLAGKIQLWGVTDLVAYSVLKTMNKAPNMLKKYYTIHKDRLYIGFNKGVPDSIVQKFQETLNAMKNDGTYDRIINKYYDELMAFSGPQ